MLFKREDLGLYFALGLTGAGIGLLVGAFIASRRKSGGVQDDWSDEPIRINHEEFAEKLSTREQLVKGYEEGPDTDFTEEETAFIEEFEPNSVQLQMYISKLVSLEQLKLVIEEERKVEESEPYSYKSAYDMKKPDLAELVPDIGLDLIDDRYYVDVAPVGDKVDKEFLFTLNDERFSLVSSRGNVVDVPDITMYISAAAWSAAFDLLVKGGVPVFITDNEEKLSYSFELIGNDSSFEKDELVK